MRLGRIIIDRELIYDILDQVSEGNNAFEDFFIYDRGPGERPYADELFAASPHFDEIEDGEVIPTYELIMTRDQNGNVELDHVERR